MCRALSSTRGQAAVELVAVLPLVVLAVAAAAQVALAGHAAWAAEQAARSAARAGAVGGDPRTAAARALPRHLERGMRVRASPGGRVAVRLRVPALFEPLRLGTVSARAGFEPQS